MRAIMDMSLLLLHQLSLLISLRIGYMTTAEAISALDGELLQVVELKTSFNLSFKLKFKILSGVD